MQFFFIFALFVLFLFGCQPGQEEKNPFDYDVEKYQKTDPALVLYKEIQGISLSLKSVSGIAISHKDNLYVAGEESLAVFNKQGEKISQKKLDGMARCIAIDQEESIYLGINNYIEVHQGTLIRKWADLPKNSLLTSLAVTEKDVFVADAANKIVLRFDKSGKFINRIGEKDEKKGRQGLVIYQPHLDIAPGEPGKLWVVNPGKHRLESYDYEGNLLSFWGQPSPLITGFCGCCNPSHIAILSDGSFITSEKNLFRIKIYDKKGKFLGVVAGMENFKRNTVPLDVARDSQNRIFILDSKSKQVRIFIPL